MLTKAKALTGYRLKGLDGDFGKVREFLFDDQHWAVRYLVADTGTWLNDRQVLISPYALGEVDGKSHHLAVKLTKAQIEGSPNLSTDLPVSKQFESQYHAYYDWPIYWNGPYAWGPYPTPFLGPKEESPEEKHTNSNGKEWNPHLRSTIAVSEYSIESTDGDIGRVVDFIIDETSWAIRYLVIDTGTWLPGKQVLIAAHWIDKVSWDLGRVFVTLTKDAVRHSPEYTASALLTREYELELHGHFNRDGYWVEPTGTQAK